MALLTRINDSPSTPFTSKPLPHSSASPKTPTTFFSLPPELREAIYTLYALAPPSPNNYTTPPTALLHTNRQIRSEYRQVLHRQLPTLLNRNRIRLVLNGREHTCGWHLWSGDKLQVWLAEVAAEEGCGKWWMDSFMLAGVDEAERAVKPPVPKAVRVLAGVLSKVVRNEGVERERLGTVVEVARVLEEVVRREDEGTWWVRAGVMWEGLKSRWIGQCG